MSAHGADAKQSVKPAIKEGNDKGKEPSFAAQGKSDARR